MAILQNNLIRQYRPKYFVISNISLQKKANDSMIFNEIKIRGINVVVLLN